jgi:hypothetical protein
MLVSAAHDVSKAVLFALLGCCYWTVVRLQTMRNFLVLSDPTRQTGKLIRRSMIGMLVPWSLGRMD